MDARSRVTLVSASLAGAALIHILLAACGGGSTPGAQAQEDGSSAVPVSGAALPSGLVMALAGAQPPAGWLLCDGRPISRTQYAALFAAIGIANGSGDGATTFNLPDYRGRFLRGVDESAGNDPDAAKRTAPSPGANVGDAVGSLEASAFAQHQHGIVDPGHGHGINDPGHGHGVTDPGHIHQACFGEETETTVEPVGQFGRTADWWENWDGCTNNVVQRATTGISINGNLTGISVQSATTGIGVQTATTGVSELPAGSSSETRPVNVAVYWVIKT